MSLCPSLPEEHQECEWRTTDEPLRGVGTGESPVLLALPRVLDLICHLKLRMLSHCILDLAPLTSFCGSGACGLQDLTGFKF